MWICENDRCRQERGTPAPGRFQTDAIIDCYGEAQEVAYNVDSVCYDCGSMAIECRYCDLDYFCDEHAIAPIADTVDSSFSSINWVKKEDMK